MTEREQIRRVSRWNRDLARENARLRADVVSLKRRVRELESTNTNLLVERDATDHLLGVAMDDLLGGGEGAVA